jgi:hypothetical protein
VLTTIGIREAIVRSRNPNLLLNGTTGRFGDACCSCFGSWRLIPSHSGARWLYRTDAFGRMRQMRRYAPKREDRMAFATVLSVTPRTRAMEEAGIPSRLRRSASVAIRR